MQSITLRTIADHYGILDNYPQLPALDLIKWYEERGYRYRHMSVRAGYIPKMLPGNYVVANYSGKFGKGIQIVEGLSTSRVTVHYLIRKEETDGIKA